MTPFTRRLHPPTIFIIFLLCFISGRNFAQELSHFKGNSKGQILSTTKSSVFIENVGQYGKVLEGHEQLGAVKFGFEGLDMPVLFTAKGLIHLQRRLNPLTQEQEERFEKQGLKEEEIERKKTITDRVITMEWVGANPQARLVAEEKTTAYHTYGTQSAKAYGYKKITYKNMYPGIDVVYHFNDHGKIGFEYTLIVSPGADLSVVKMKYDGDIKKIKIDGDGNLLIKSDINGITETLPISYYNIKPLNNATGEVETKFTLEDKQVSFSFPKGYDKNKSLVLDPFVSATSILSGTNAGKAKDVDFDYQGNVYVSGGGDQASAYMLAKYDAAGVLQWTFSGVLTIPAWNFGPYFGGWVVDKATGNIYLGQGFDFTTGFIVIRLSTTGLYDNYFTSGNPNFRENWKMIWNCNNGVPQIMVAGGGTNSNINLGILTPPSIIPSATNITGIPSIAFQDMADMVIDPVTNSMYTLYASGSVPSLNNAIYKNDQPYSSGTIAWNVQSGYNVLQEAANRPYLLGFGLTENSTNALAINASNVYYWDGRNLKAINKATGANVGTPLTIAGNTALMQGGIIADACDNIFVGFPNGLIKVYKFNGSVFDDAAAADINVTGYPTKSVYDLAYNEQEKLLYASGDGFVASFDVSAYCNSTTYTLNITPDCATSSVTLSLSPAPPAGSVVTYVLLDGATVVASNTTGVFGSLNPTVTYTINATINLNCSGTRTTGTFTMPGPVLNTTLTHTSCGASAGAISAVGSSSTGPYTYSLDGINFLPSGNFAGLAGGIYTVTVKDAGGCKTSQVVTILNSNGPVVTLTSTDATCGNNTGNITIGATGGTAPYMYSKDGVTYQSNHVFSGLLGGLYTVSVRDANGCINAVRVTILSGSMPAINAIPASATCGNNNGSITAIGSGGLAPLQYSINGNVYQAGNTFTNLTPGGYTVSVKDASGCISTISVNIANSAAPNVTATSTTASCANANGTITATGSGGINPLYYSIDGFSYQAENLFTGLAPGVYTVTVQDAVGCLKTVNVTVGSTNGPSVTAVSTSSTCGSANGSITATGAAGVAPYQYSINNITYQASALFTGLGPGNYIVFVKDNVGCISAGSVVVTNIAGPTVTAISTPASCNVSDGTITATGTGGTGALQFSKDGFTFQPTGNFGGLAPAVYTITVKDALNCISTVNVTVGSAVGLVLNVSNISSSCSINNGEINASASGGSSPYQFSIDGSTYQASANFTGVAPGNYTVYVKDNNGCIITRTTTVVSNTAPQLTLSSVNANCNGNNGRITALGTGGTGILQYSLDAGAYQAGNSFVNVAPGLHTVTVKDALNCITSRTVTIINAGAGTPPTNVTFVIKDALPCTGGTTKIKNIKGVPSGGGNTYTFSLDGGAFTSANQFSGVGPGTHTVTAMNDAGCTVTRLAVVGTGVAATATAIATSTPCNTSNGTITVTGVGPNTPYHVSINGAAGPWVTFFPPGANSMTFSGLAAGTYTVTMADDADFTVGPPDIPGACLNSIFVAVPSTGGPIITASQTNGTCGSPNSGSITASGTGGTAPFDYSINGGAYQPSSFFNSLSPGSYVITIKDATGCVNAITVNLPAPVAPTITGVAVPAACGLANGSITATGLNGTAPLTYSIDGFNFQPANTFTNLVAGVYILYVKDASGCYSSTTVTVAAAPRPFVTAFTLPASCGNNNGIIFVTGSSGVGPYEFSLDGLLYQSSNSFPNLAAGSYTVFIKDSRDCINTTGITLGNTGAATVSTAVTAAKCGAADGIITVTATGGSAPLQYSIDGINFQISNIFSGLLPGNYTVTVKGSNGCLSGKTTLVSNSVGPHTLTASILHAACGLSNGSITALGVGGTAPLQYSLNGVTYQAGATFNAMAAGDYTVYVKDANGCINTTLVTLLDLSGPAATANSTPATCTLRDGSIIVTPTGGTGVIFYSIDGSTYQASPVFTGLAAGTYTITVRDTRLCTSTVDINVDPFVVPAATSSTTDASCGNPNGTIIVNGTGGTGPYEYSLDGITYQTANSFSGLVANTYSVWIKDANGCTGTVLVILSDSPPMSGVFTVGSGGDFATLTAAVNAYNTQCIDGPITFLLTDALYSVNETFPIVINHTIYASPVNTLTIRPAIGASPLISGNNSTAIIQFNAADFVSIDGANLPGSNTRDLSIVNSFAGNAPVIWMNSINATDGATNNAIMNCIITGESSTTTLAGILTSGLVAGTDAEAANENNIIQHNLVSKAQSGILMYGTAGNDTGNLVTDNEIGSITATDKLSSTGILLKQQAFCEVNNNIIHGILSTGNGLASGLLVTGTASTISIKGNKISDIKNTSVSGAGSNGICLSSNSTDANINLYNNFISDIASFGSINGRGLNDNGYGIVINAGGGYHVYHNTVLLNTSQSAPGFPAAFQVTSSVTTPASIDVMNNIFGNAQTQPGNKYAIQANTAVTVFASIDYNDYYTSGSELGYIGSNRLTLTDIQTGFGANTHSINITPAYLSTSDLHIDRNNVSNGVNLGDRGIAIAGIDIDIDNTTRNGFSPDLGADEWLKPNYGSWVGKISTDWLVPENWETNVVPDGNTDVTITGGYAFMPTIITTQAVRDLNMSAPDLSNDPILTLSNGTIQINGQINRTGGNIDGLFGTIEMNGTSPQNIPANMLLNNSLNNLLIGNSSAAGVTLLGPVDIYRSVTYSASGLQLKTGDFLTFKSTQTETAWLGDMTGKSIVGKATVERYIPNHSKAWQLLAVPTTGQTIKDAWQEGSAAPNSNPNPGFGTQITSNVPNAITHPNPGFDLFSANGPSMKIFNPATGLYEGVSSTSNLIDNPKGYMLFVRGDRSATTFNAPATATVLRTKGSLYTPANPPAVMNIAATTPPYNFASVGNPYASAIDLTKVILNESGGGVQAFFYLWDPKLTSVSASSYGLGGFQVLSRNGNTYDVTPGGGSYGNSTSVIQSGQAFFVNAPFTPGTVKFTEACKVEGSTIVNRVDNLVIGKRLRTNLSVIRSGEPILLDGNLLQFDESLKDSVDAMDALKFTNAGENCSLKRYGKLLSVERRPLIQTTDTIFYQVGQLKQQAYRFDFIANELAQPGLTAFLEDRYLQSATPVGLQDTTTVFFTVDSNEVSRAADRFRIVFQLQAPVPVTITRLEANRNDDKTVSVKWYVDNETSIERYFVERSSNGRQFTDINNRVPTGNQGGSSVYQLKDHRPLDEYNYYRVRAVGVGGHLQYSNIVKIAPLKEISGISVYPNPVVNRTLQLLFTGQRKGTYYIYLRNKIGQVVYNHSVQVDSRYAQFSLVIDKTLASSTYQISIVSDNGIVSSESLIIQ